MKVPFELSDEILKILTQNYNKTYTLEKLTSIIMLTNNMTCERACQAKVLDALIFLDNKGFIVLNLDTDESSLAKKAPIKTNN
ncbi:hypothetical protein AR687_22615 [Flavobacteriaceae bacterium CRH]|nr:hypothetical protein AR687_22615 [Flavobacteriaceae bacterium CRH]